MMDAWQRTEQASRYYRVCADLLTGVLEDSEGLPSKVGEVIGMVSLELSVQSDLVLGDR